MIDPLYSLSGFGVGLLVGMTGVGGGSLMTPLLILLFGIHPATAVGTDLLYASATKAGGSLVHGIPHNIEWPAVRRLAAGSVPTSIVTLADNRLACLRFPAGRFVAWYHSRQSYRHPRSRIGAAVIVGRDAYRCCRQAALRSCRTQLINAHRLHTTRTALKQRRRLKFLQELRGREE